MSVAKCLSCSRNGESCSEMENCDATNSEVLDLSTLTESVAGDDATEQSEALGSRQVRSIYLIHEDPQETFFCDQHDFLVATDALFSKGDKRISCCGNLISTLISAQKT